MDNTEFSPLIDLIERVDQMHIPPMLLRQAKLLALDSLGCILAGNAMEEQVALIAFTHLLGGAGEATILGTNYRSTASFAALINGSASVSTELDEGCAYAAGHPGSYIMPSAWAVGEAADVDGMRFLRAVILGYEICTRVARAALLHPTVHPHGTGVVGASAVSAYLLGQDRESIAESMKLGAGMLLASSWPAAVNGATVRNMLNGLACQNGVYAAYLPCCGFKGEDDAMTTAFACNLGTGFNKKWLADGLPDGEFYLMRNYFKLYACSRYNHAPIDAALVLRQKIKNAADIDSFCVATYGTAARLGQPAISTVFSSRFSTPYCVAAALVLGHCGIDAFSKECLHDPLIRGLAERGTVIEDPDFSAMVPDMRPSRLTVYLKDGSCLQETCFKAGGEWTNPYSEKELQNKFLAISSPVIGTQAARRALSAIGELERSTSIRAFIRALKSNSAEI